MLTMQDSTHFRQSGRRGRILRAWGSEHFATYLQLQQPYRQRFSGAAGWRPFRFRAVHHERMEKVGMASIYPIVRTRLLRTRSEAATRPALFTHATCRRSGPGHARAKSDEAIRKIAKTGGVMGIAFIRFFRARPRTGRYRERAEHFDYVRKLVGVEHLAVGSDWTSWERQAIGSGGLRPEKASPIRPLPFHVEKPERVASNGLDHPKRMFDLTEGLIARGIATPISS